MKNIIKAAVCAALLGAGAQAYAQNEPMPLTDNGKHFLADSHISVSDKVLARFAAHPAITGEIPSPNSLQAQLDHLSSYQTAIPRSTQFVLSEFEFRVLTAYLDKPDDKVLAQFLAFYYLQDSLLKRRNVSGTQLKNSILADYFLNRVDDLYATEPWTERLKNRNEKKLNRYFNLEKAITYNEDHQAHLDFYNTFNYQEGERFQVAAALLDDFVNDPTNVFTGFLIKASNTWIGGETDFDDPSILHNFVIASYFSKHTIDRAQQMEQNWLQDPANDRFRLAPILGGLSVLDRGWLARVHQDQDAISALTDEHRLWREIHPLFHAFTVGLDFFEANDKFMEGFFAWGTALSTNCPEIRTCMDRPRFSFNILGMIVGYVDYLTKLGALEDARNLLQWQYAPQLEFNNWTLGQEAWQHRVDNLDAIAALYHNDDPSDDPNFFFVKTKKWGGKTSTCQTCHQAQERHWSDEDKATVIPHIDDILTIENWPLVSTTWYGAIKQPCHSLPQWQSKQSYQQGDLVQLNGVQYQAKWWTYAEWPAHSGQWDVWQAIGSCDASL
ncbi:carbohydrate-binding protein [Motilimonas pumila]|uniref:carbohydrate-binding protein n=1 Tax=Motilimonas pumila TaxID=2303987 RepID=UPI001314C575|nr:hypothetical protein [Motilimonas pumila]